MSQAVEELAVAIFSAAFFAVGTSLAVRVESKAGAWIGAVAFFWFSLLAAWIFFWRMP